MVTCVLGCVIFPHATPSNLQLPESGGQQKAAMLCWLKREGEKPYWSINREQRKFSHLFISEEN